MNNFCLIHDNSLRFSRAVYGFLIVIAFFIHNYWLILVAAILMILALLSLKLNILYQLYILFSKKILKDKSGFIQKEVGELNFVSGLTGAILLFGFLLLYFEKWVTFAWGLVLVTALLIFLACFVGFCVASLTYALFKKLFNKK